MKKVLSITLVVILLVVTLLFAIPVSAVEGDTVSLRTETSKTFDLGNGIYRTEGGIGPIHYKDNYQDSNEQWKDIDLTLVNDEIHTAPYDLVIDRDNFSFTITSKKDGSSTTFTMDKIGASNAPDWVVLPVQAANSLVWKSIIPGLDIIILPTTTGVKFQRVISNPAGLRTVEFVVTGDRQHIQYRGRDAKGWAIEVVPEWVGNRLTERFESLDRPFPITIDPSVEYDSVASQDDGYAGQLFYSHTADYLDIGWENAGGGCYMNSWMRYAVNIPQDAFIITAKFDYVSNGDRLISFTQIQAWDADDPNYPTSWANYQVLPLTDASVAFEAGPTLGGNTYDSPEIKTVIQEIISRVDWSSGEHLVIMWNDLLEVTPSDGPGKQIPWSWNYSDHTYGPRLYITYTTAVAPTVISSAADNISGVSATLYSEITDTGGENATNRGFKWDTDSGAPYANSWDEDGDFGTGTFEHDIAGLPLDTEIFWIAFATNIVGTGESGERSFTTYGTPTVTNSAADNIEATSAIGYGDITVLDGANATTRGFEWSLTTGAPYEYDVHEDGDFGTGAFNNTMTGLPSDDTIYWRAYAIDAVGTGYSGELTFNTLLPLPGAPTDFNIVQTDAWELTLTWIAGSDATTTIIRVKQGGYPTSYDDGWEVYNGALETITFDIGDSELEGLFFRAWSHNATGYSVDYVSKTFGGNNMLFISLIVLALGLTVFASRQKFILLSIAAGIAWLTLGILLLTSPGTINMGEIGEPWVQALGFLFIIMILVPLLFQMRTDIRHEASVRFPKGVPGYPGAATESYSTWGPDPRKKGAPGALERQRAYRQKLKSGGQGQT